MPSQPPRPGKFKTWITRFASTQKPKHREGEDKDEPPHTVFGAPLKVSLRYASVQISTANEEGELFVWGFVPIVVGKCGLYLKENSAEPGTFRTEGSSERISELQGLFEAPPSYGISIDWKQESYTTHDIACVLRAYLTQLPESVIPHAESEAAREALVKQPFNQDEVIRTYKRLIRAMPPVNQYLLLYVLDLLSVFARKSDKNQMTATDLAAMFHPGLISSAHKISPAERDSSQRVLEFLIAHQDWFMLDIAPPPAHHGGIELWVSAPAFWDLSTPTKVEQRAEGDSSVDWSSQEGNLSVTQRRPLPSAPRAAAPGTTVSPPTQATAALLSTKGVPQDSGERPSRLQEGPSRPPVLLTRKPPPPERSTNGLEGRQNGALDAPSTINTKITAAKEAGELSGGPHVQHKPLKRSSDPLQHSVRRPSVQDTKDIPEYTENLGINVPLTVKPEISAPRKTDQQQDPHRSSLSPTPIHDSHAKSSEDNTARQQGQLSIKDVHAEDEVQSKEDRMAERWAGTSKLAHKSSDSIAASHQDDVVSSPAESEINVLARSSGASALSSSQLEASSDSIASARPPPSAASHQDDVIPTPAASEIDVLARSSEASALSSSQLEAQVMWEDDALRHINGVLASWERRRPLLSMITAPDADRRGLSSSQLRENLGEVEAQINTLLTLILNSRGAARAAEQLEGNDAQSFIDAIQDVCSSTFIVYHI
ncbi:hypothetical protein K438DRAFT_1722059 [Mycena galopus ATCC 62051]|nr:hypothetical protein K438DRAFT_1722059 [Mycena galopus ATCC 62051]